MTGTCLAELGEYRAAAEQFIHTHNSYPETPEGAAASFQGADLYRRLGRDLEALIEYRHALNEIIGGEGYRNPWLSLDELKSRLLAAYQQYLGAEKFEITLQLTRIMQPLFPADQELLLRAEAYGIWGQTLMSQADKAPRARRNRYAVWAGSSFAAPAFAMPNWRDFCPPTKHIPIKYGTAPWRFCRARISRMRPACFKRI